MKIVGLKQEIELFKEWLQKYHFCYIRDCRVNDRCIGLYVNEDECVDKIDCKKCMEETMQFEFIEKEEPIRRGEVEQVGLAKLIDKYMNKIADTRDALEQRKSQNSSLADSYVIGTLETNLNEYQELCNYLTELQAYKIEKSNERQCF